MSKISIFLIFTSLLIFIDPAFSCDCEGVSTKEYYENAEVVFSGKVLKVIKDSPFWSSFNDKETPKPITLVQMELFENFKGIEPKLKFITIPIDFSSCQFTFLEGNEYLVFGEEVVSNPGMIMTWDCMGNKLLNENNEALLDRVRSLQAIRASNKHTAKKSKPEKEKADLESNQTKLFVYIILALSLLLNLILIIRKRL